MQCEMTLIMTSYVVTDVMEKRMQEFRVQNASQEYTQK